MAEGLSKVSSGIQPESMIRYEIRFIVRIGEEMDRPDEAYSPALGVFLDIFMPQED